MNNDFFDELDKKDEENKSFTAAPSTEDSSLDSGFQISTTKEIYSEKINNPEKRRKKLKERPFAIALLTAFSMTVIFGSGLFLSKDYIKDYILKDVAIYSEKDQSVDIPGAPASLPSGVELSPQKIAAMVNPSIVGISNMSYSPNSYLNINTLQSVGSGIIISSEGYIVTNNHVISNAKKIKVTLSSGDEVDAKLVGTDPTTDMAVIKIDPSGLDITAATLGHSSSLQVGDTVFAVGNPLGLTFAGSVTHGIVSALNRKLDVDGTTYNLIQTDAAINSGNSGGALVNTRGEVIGINSVKVASDGVEGLGFAIPIDDVKDVIQDLIKSGYVKGRPSIGINIVEITPQIAYYYELPVNYGLFINSLIEGGSAEKAGLEIGDIIIAFNGEKVSSASDFITKRNTFKAGDTITLTVNREGKEKDFKLLLQEDKPSSAQ